MLILLEYILWGLSGACVGISAGIGLFIPFKQPKNLKRQLFFGVMAVLNGYFAYLMMVLNDKV